MCTLTASIITAVAGGLWQGYTANQQAKAQARQAEQNAQIADQNAQKLQEQAEQQAENNRINEENKHRQMVGKLARQRVNIAAGGLTATGSALNALSDSQVEMEKELAIDRYNSRQQVDNILQRSTDQVNQANQYKRAAEDYRKAGKWAWINAGVNTAFSLAGTLYGAKSAAVQNAGGTGSAVRAGGYSANGLWDTGIEVGLTTLNYKPSGPSFSSNRMDWRW